jgi:hypothetical protein
MEFSDKVKVWLSCPKTHVDVVRLTIGDAGIGTIGNYTHCTFVTEGKGYFRASVEATPYIGEVGVMNEVEEMVIEFSCTKDQLPLLKEILKEHHPYEEVAIDIFPLLSF